MEKELINHIIEIKEALGGIHARLDGQDSFLSDIKTQTLKTNGRVTSLEGTVQMLAKVSTQNSGLIKINQDDIKRLIDSGGGLNREVNELKKIKIEDSEIKKEKIKARTTLAVAVVGALSGLVAIFK